MSISEEVVKVNELTITEVYCDDCGEKIATLDSNSWTNSIPGVWAKLQKPEIDKLEMEIKKDVIANELLTFTMKTQYKDEAKWILCHDCADSLEEDLEERFGNNE